MFHLDTECGNKNHSAAFPPALPAWFIKLFTNPGDVVLDPFMGSGTTLVEAVKLGRQAYGIDLKPEYVDQARQALKSVQPALIPLEARREAKGR